SSPETLMRTTVAKDTETIDIKTIVLAGTRPMFNNPYQPERNKQMRDDLLNDPKEIKEHVMSVRQVQVAELSQVCLPGSVCVKGLMQVLEQRTVQHLKSTLCGTLSPDQTPWDGLRALFPAVTVTGVDRKTAIEKIAIYEHLPRGLYSGCIGWIDAAGNSEFALALRSAFEDRSGVTIRAGAGIIAESKPPREYDETYHKMSAIHRNLVLTQD
ncbi:MAG TPA: chorismate-binding protein, partial [Candidatus Saccharimonadales bacterium]|nr:chorismate-binding protein [Candidatus Saccharimonadales bacterium]